jgi:hypothetical protein
VIAIRPVGEATNEVVLAERVDADEEFRFRVDVVLPANLAPGRYRLVVGNARHEAYGEPTIRIMSPRPESGYSPRSTNSIRAIGAPSPFRGPSFSIRV